MLSGKIEQKDGIHKSKAPPLDYKDARMISRIAKKVGRLDKQIEWLETALIFFKEETGGRRELEKAIMEHDDVLLKYGLGHISNDTPDGLPQVPVFTFNRPIGAIKTSPTFEKSLKRSHKEKKIIKIGQNIKKLENPTETEFLTKTFHRMWYYGQNTTIALCQGKTLETAEVVKKQRCLNLHYYNPYLLLGPFKYELLSDNPHVGIFRDFYSNSEIDSILDRARGNIKSTPYQVYEQKMFYIS